MNDSSFDGSLARLFAARRRLGGMPMRKNIHGFIQISFALLLTVIAILWVLNHLATKQRIKDPSSIHAKTQNTRSKSQELSAPEDKLSYQISLRKMKGSQHRSGHYKIAAADSIQKESAEQEIIHDEVFESKSDGSSDSVNLMYSADGGSNQFADNNHARSMPDLARSIENFETAEASQMEQAIRDLWIIAADLDAPDEALEALEFFIMENHDTDLIDLASSAVEDLQRVLASKQNTQIKTDTSEGNDDEDQSGPPDQISLCCSHDDSKALENSETSAILQAKMEDLSEQALIDPDASKRGDAIQALSNFRNDAAVDILIDAADDPEPMNRYLALQSLWISAADGPREKKDFLRHSLQQAQGDIDTQVADLATSALKDLEQLEQKLEEAEMAISFEQGHYSENYSPPNPAADKDGHLVHR